MEITRSHRTTDAFREMSREPFTSRSAGVLFWGGGYLVVAIAEGLVLAALWPQANACLASCSARLEAGAIAIIVLVSLGLLVGALSSAILLGRSGASGEAAGLATVRSAWSWGLAVPAGALFATACAARLRERVRTRCARPIGSARVRRA